MYILWQVLGLVTASNNRQFMLPPTDLRVRYCLIVLTRVTARLAQTEWAANMRHAEHEAENLNFAQS